MAKKYTVQTASFIPLSDIRISEAGKDLISQSSNITFGDANRTLFSVERLLTHVDFNAKDTAVLERLHKRSINEFNGLLYIDLEN